MIPPLGSINLGSFNREWLKFYLLEQRLLQKDILRNNHMEKPHRVTLRYHLLFKSSRHATLLL